MSEHDQTPRTASATSSSPAGAYVTTSWWYAHEPDEWETARGLSGWQSAPLTSEHPDLESAERQGQKDGCMRGVRRVEVRSPDGALQALWDKESLVTIKRRRYPDQRGRMLYDISHLSNRWQRISEESRALSKRQVAETLAARDALRAELGHEPTSMQVADRLRRPSAAHPPPEPTTSPEASPEASPGTAAQPEGTA